MANVPASRHSANDVSNHQLFPPVLLAYEYSCSFYREQHTASIAQRRCERPRSQAVQLFSVENETVRVSSDGDDGREQVMRLAFQPRTLSPVGAVQPPVVYNALTNIPSIDALSVLYIRNVTLSGRSIVKAVIVAEAT